MAPTHSTQWSKQLCMWSILVIWKLSLNRKQEIVHWSRELLIYDKKPFHDFMCSYKIYFTCWFFNKYYHRPTKSNTQTIKKGLIVNKGIHNDFTDPTLIRDRRHCWICKLAVMFCICGHISVTLIILQWFYGEKMNKNSRRTSSSVWLKQLVDNTLWRSWT